MKPLTKAAATASIIAGLVYAVLALVGYLHLLAHQPPHEPGKPFPPDVTSFPPSFAWFSALPCGAGVFVVAFFMAFTVFKSRHHEPDA
jgi:hypothetical protein